MFIYMNVKPIQMKLTLPMLM